MGVILIKMKAVCCGCNHEIKNIEKEYKLYLGFKLTCVKCGWVGYWNIIQDNGFIHKGIAHKDIKTEIKKNN